MTARRSQVLIVGAGPAGCAAGILLGRAGVDVLAIDRARFPRDKICGDALSNGAVALLRELGCGEALGRLPQAQVRAADARFPDGSSIRRHYDAPGLIVPRLALDDALRAALEASGARLLQHTGARELLQEGGRVVGARGPEGTFRAEVTIAADGHGSLAWRRLGRPAASGSSMAVAVRAYYEGVAYPAGEDVSEHCFLAELPHGYGWVFPAVDGRSNVGIYQRADHLAANTHRLTDLLDRFVASRPDRFAHARRLGKPRTWPLPLSLRLSRVSAPGLLAAGDAGRLIDPLSGEGIWQALISGKLAAESALGALSVGELTPALRLRYELACARQIQLAGVVKAVVQRGVTSLVASGRYRNPLVQRALRRGYGRGWLEVTKAAHDPRPVA